jgi:Rieske Fe-S protein
VLKLALKFTKPTAEVKLAKAGIAMMEKEIKENPAGVREWSKDPKFKKLGNEIWSEELQNAKKKMEAGIMDESIKDALGPEFAKLVA